MSYTYPEALTALESVANDFIKVLRPREIARVLLVCDSAAQTASVTWDAYNIKVNMPVRPAASRMTQAEFENWVSYLLHELGHPAHTDMVAWQAACRDGVARMVNALEDVRMEKALIVSGIVPNAKSVLSRLLSRKIVEARSNGWKPNARREFGWTICVLGRAANGYAFDGSDLAWIDAQIKAGGTVHAVLAWALPDLAACKSTADCTALAKRIMAALAAPQVDGPGGFPGEQGEQGEQGESEQGESESGAQPREGEGEEGPQEGQGEGEGEEGEEGEGEQDERTDGPPSETESPSGETGGSEGEEGGKGGKGQGDGTFDADEKPVKNDKDLTERELAPDDSADENLTGAEAVNERVVINILRSGIIGMKPKDQGHSRNGPNAERLKSAAARASKQRALLARALRANDTDEREGGKRTGRLNRSALARVAAGSSTIFERRDVCEGFDTDVHVLLDASGSMGDAGKMSAALEVGLIVTQAAASVGASCTTEVFNSIGYIRAGALAGKRTPNPADFGVLVNQADGGTPLSPHMARAAVAQAARAPGKRRVLFLVTDGGCDYGQETVKRMARHLEKTCGTVIAHVSIFTALRGSFKAEVRVAPGQAIADVGLDHFVRVLQAL